MANNIIIQEGGVGKQLVADKLKVNKVGGGTCLYVPEESVTLGTKSVTENGTYRAEDDGYVGYSQVYVNVSGGGGGGDSIVGRDSDGDEAVVTKDPDTGDLVVTKIPSSIEVITPPTNPYGTYIDGQTITKDGMVVKAYSATGTDMGTVPINEVTINPTIAVYDESKDTRGISSAVSELETAMVQPIVFGKEIGHSYAGATSETSFSQFVSADAAALYGTDGDVIFASKTAPAGYITTDDGTHTYIIPSTNDNTFTHDGKTVYYDRTKFNSGGGWSIWGGGVGNSASGVPGANDAWTMVYGDIESLPAGSPQTITVSWSRPGDGAILETSFEILVGPPRRAGR